VTDHVLAPVWSYYLRKSGRYVFPPMSYVAEGSRARFDGTGPPLWSCVMVYAPPTQIDPWYDDGEEDEEPPSEWILVARPRKGFPRWATTEARERDGRPTLPGSYVLPPGEGMGHTKRMAVVGGKPDWLHRSIVSQYSAPGALVVDPVGGGGGAGKAAIQLGRRAIVGDVLREHAELCAAALHEGVRLRDEAAAYLPPAPRVEQMALLLGPRTP